MVEEQLVARDIRDRRVLGAMRDVPRHLFVPARFVPQAYQDSALSIGYGQTISQPYMVALMLEALELRGDENVLDVGAGSGYQAALLARLAKRVTALEVVPELAKFALSNLRKAESSGVAVICADGTLGWQSAAPYDAVAVAAAAPRVPRCLVEQLAEGGRLVIPVGDGAGQTLTRMRMAGGRVESVRMVECTFVPLVGEQQEPSGRPPGARRERASDSTSRRNI
jgi:protein-L-isoaspartate(D-aspartate) O-methyltransferase